MRRVIFSTAAFVLVAAIVAANTADDEQRSPKASVANELVGTWKMVSAKYNGREFKFPAGRTTLKHVTPSQFMWASYMEDGKVYRAAGGFVRIRGDNYEETPEYGVSSDFELIKGKTHVFKAKVDGNTWHHQGQLASGLTIEESSSALLNWKTA